MAMTQIRGAQIRDREIVSGKIALTAVIEELIADSAVTNAKVANDAVSTLKIVDSNVTTAKIADANVTEAKIASNAVTTAKISDSNITTAKIADSNVTTAKIADANVTNAKLASGAVSGGAQFTATVDADGKVFSGDATFSSPLNIADAVDADHAVAKGQMDSAISSVQTSIAALGNAFNYVAVVDGGEDEANATDMDLQAEKDPGDYYKVGTAGYFKVGSAQAAFYANANDGLLFNTSNVLDKIDNTNSDVQGTTDYIAVTGSSDTGFVVDVDADFKGRMSDAETKVGTVALTTTAADLSAAINEHDAEIGDVGTLTTTATSLVTAINELDAKSVEDIYVRETPSGTVDGSNAAFALANTPIASTVQMYVNGLLQEPVEDYNVSGTTVTFVSAPLSGDRVRAIYFKPSA